MALGVSPEVWRTTTPRELLALINRLADKEQARAEREDRRAGLICATMASAWLKKRGGGSWTPDDFFRKPKKAMTAQDMERAMDGVMAHYNKVHKA